MTDINTNKAKNEDTEPSSFSESKELSNSQDRTLSLIELFYFAYRDFTGESDEVLAKIGFGRAHHRVIHFVHHYPGLRVAELLNILKITKQSLARVLKQLIDQNYISQRPGDHDRRQRHLYTTPKGQKLAQNLSMPQLNRLVSTMASLEENERETVEKFLLSLIEKDHRHEVITLMAENGHTIGDINQQLSPKER